MPDSRPGPFILGYTPTPQGEAALGLAITEAKAHKAALVVVNVSPAESYVDTNLAQANHLEALGNILQASGLEHEIIQHIGQDPATDILDIATAREAGRIVLGLRHRSAVGKLLLGSTAQNILLNADCPVLTIRT
ncbi:universal stress protein [Arthrobacter globiformis]|uniref:universal stress protein n=1 Tax=Arthrobacter globiformis TaxID=1665 RepID=UPI000B407AF4|nr:universal stress protein [Arthrobacter globiformis]